MDVLHAIQANLLTPMPLFFALGLFATLVRSELKVPEALYIGLVLYLLAAIGMKGGAEIREVGLMSIWVPLMAAAFLGVLIPCIGYVVLRRLGGFTVHDAAAVAGHYGSVSAVTFAVASQFLVSLQFHPEAYISAFLAIMELIGIVASIFLARLALQVESTPSNGWLKVVMHEVMTGKGTMILFGALVIGYLTGHEGVMMTKAFFVDPFKGVLCLFMLEMGLLAGQRLAEVRTVGVFLIAFGILMPILYGLFGVLTGGAVGLSISGATLLGVLAASASYIAAPAAMRISLPEANPSLYLTASLGITFPFNIALGIPLYFWFARVIWG
ncbi:MAG TPA: sodium-dependent bicarbonate transport family permease [Nitrospiraceae bacterium]|nr:sodium-dependent bicarbonate transport family permease [Nitrospiraceae bacterium]